MSKQFLAHSTCLITVRLRAIGLIDAYINKEKVTLEWETPWRQMQGSARMTFKDT